YEATKSVESVAQLFECLMTAVEGKGDAKSDAKSRFFERSGLTAARHASFILVAIDPTKLSFSTISQLIIGAPKLKYIGNPVTPEEKSHVEWFKGTPFWNTKALAEEAIAEGRVAPDMVRDVENAISFFMEEWANLANDTRSSIVAS